MLLFCGGVALLQRHTAAQSPAAADVPRYALTIRVKPGAPRLAGEATITMPPDTARPSFVLAAMMRMESVELGDGNSFRRVQTDSTSLPGLRPEWGYVRWRVAEDIPPAAGSVTLRVRYSLDTAATGFVFGVDDAVTFASGINTAWYPQLEDGRSAATGRVRTKRGTGTMRFEVSEGVTVHAVGKPNATRTSSTRFTFDVNGAAYFNFAAGRFHVRTSQPSDGGLPSTATYYLSPRDSAGVYARQSLAVLKALTAEFGPYPFDHFAIVELPTDLAQRAGFAGASADGAIFTTSEYLNRPFNAAYYGHEIGHQWWGVAVRPTGPRGAMMLQEGLAQYGGLRAVEAIDGPQLARAFREHEYPEYFGQGGELYFRTVAGGHDAPLADLPTSEEWARDIADSKGFMALNVLSNEIGHDRLRSAFHEMVREFAPRRLTWADFVGAVNRAAGRDLSSFFGQWFDRSGVPEVSTELVRATREVHVRQPGETFAFTTDLEWFGSGCGMRTRIGVRTNDQRVAVPAGCRPDSVVVDPDYQVIRWTSALKEKYGKR
jgi:hypothetical protein